MLRGSRTAVREPVTRVRAFTTNLERRLTIEVPVRDGQVVHHGEYRVPGVPGTGARIVLDFADTAGGATGTLLPTRRPVDELDVPGVGRIAVSLVDIGNAHVFVRACDVGLRGTEMPEEIDRDGALLKRLELIRGAGAARMGMASSAGAARAETPATPILGIVSEPADYVSHLDGAAVRAGDVDLVSRVMFMQITHKTYAGTSTVCTGVAARIRGSVVAEVLGTPRNAMELRVGHPAGVIETEALVDGAGDGGLVVRRATLGRTARRILDGTVYLDR